MDDILRQAPCGIMAFGDDGRILHVNQTLGDWLGYPPDELEGKSIETILSVASRIFYNTHFFPLVKLHTRADEIFFNLVSKAREDIPVLTNTLRKPKGDSYVNICVCLPVYQRQKYEEEILQARRSAEDALRENKALEAIRKDLEGKTQELDRQFQKTVAMNNDIVQFSKIVSHDLQEPIRKIKLFANILESENDDLERRAWAVQRIQASANRLARLTIGLQQYVNINHEDDPREIDLNEVIALAKEKATKDRAFDVVHIDSDPLPSIEGYPAQLELLFYHLIDNAIQFRNTDEDLIINISSTLVEENLYRSIRDKYQFVEHLRVLFKDNGIGFENQYRDYVFELVTKAHMGRTGLGIGLALIKKIVDNHGGTVRIESEPGKGTSVVLVLPLKMR